MLNRTIGLLALVTTFTTSVAVAQTYNGGVRGVVSDASGALVPNAAVTITDDATKVVRETRTDATGVYAFNALRPSTYSLRVQAQSFGAADRPPIALATQDFLPLDLQ